MAHVLPHRPASPAWLRPASPGPGPAGCPGRSSGPGRQARELLLDAQRRLADAQARYGTPLNNQFPEHLVAVISDRDQISELTASLANTARQDWMTLENLATEMPLTTDFAAPPLPAAQALVRCRSIYPAAAMDDPVAARIISICAEAGEEARLLPEVPMKMKLADHTTALLPLTPTGTAGALIVRAPVIIATLRDYFEYSGTAPPRPCRRPSPGRRRSAHRYSSARSWTSWPKDWPTPPSPTGLHRRGYRTPPYQGHHGRARSPQPVHAEAGAAAHRRGWIG